jgi:hypothetical protein
MTETNETTVIEQQTTPAIYQRAFSIHIDNPLDGTPTCTFQQERVAEVNGEVIRQPIGEIVVRYDDKNVNAVILYQLLKDYYLELIAPPVAVPVDTTPTEEESA